MDARQPRAEAVAVRAGRVLAVGALADVRRLVGPGEETVDADGGLLLPGLHDAHLHLLGYARSHARADCSDARSIAEVRRILASHVASRPPGTWIRAAGLDEAQLPGQHLPDRQDLDEAAPAHPVRLQHRTRHLDILNTVALRQTGLWDSAAPEVERNAADGHPTGRIYHGERLMKDQGPRPDPTELAHDVRRACERLLAWGVTAVQDATATNGPEEWRLFQRLAESGDLPLRLTMMVGPDAIHALRPGEQASVRLRTGPVKLMLDEATADAATLQATISEAHAAGWAVAIHATSEAEIAVALEALASAPPPPAGQRDRIEHASTLPDALLPDLRAANVAVVGQPALIYQRGDVYLAEHPSEQHGWLHRAGSLVAVGISYAVSSDAPLTEPAPGYGIWALQHRRTQGGVALGPGESLPLEQALAAYTLGSARALGGAQTLGVLRPGTVADLVILEPDAHALEQPDLRPARLTMLAGEIAWRADGWP